MPQQAPSKAEVIVWVLGEYGILKPSANGWQAYTVGSRDEAYEELERLEARPQLKPAPDARH